MKKSDILQKTEVLASPIASELGLSIWDVSFEKEGDSFCLTVFIDCAERPVSIDDCENVSRKLEKLLDEQNFIDCSYTLCVSSAGIERVIRTPAHFNYALNKTVDVKLFSPIGNQKALTGVLKSFDENTVCIENDDKNLSIDFKNIALCKIHFDF